MMFVTQRSLFNAHYCDTKATCVLQWTCIQNTSGRKVTTDDEGYGGEWSELAMTECNFWRFDNSSPSPGWPD